MGAAPKRLRSAGHLPQAGDDSGARFSAYSFAAQQKSKASVGGATPGSLVAYV